MQRALRPWITAGVAVASAGLIVITPAAAPGLQPLHRTVRLASTDYGAFPFPEVGWSELVANTTANWTGLEQLYDNTTALYSLPMAVYSEGLSHVFNDLMTELQQLATYESAYQAALASQAGELAPVPITDLPPLPDFYADPVLNPVSAVTLLSQLILSSDFAMNAAQAGATGIYQNMLPSINDVTAQVHNIFAEVNSAVTTGTLSSGAIQADLTAIGTDVTRIEKDLSLAPSTILNDYLNGYPVQTVKTDPLAGDFSSLHGYVLNAPYTTSDNLAISPELGLLTNPLAAITANTVDGFGDGASASFQGTVPLETGTLASLLQIEQTLSDELLTETSKIAGSGVSAPPDTGSLTILGPDSLTFEVHLDQIPVVGGLITDINKDVIPFLNSVLPGAIGVANSAIDVLNKDVISYVNDILTPLSNTINSTVNPFIDAVDKIIGPINTIFHAGIHKISDIHVTFPDIHDVGHIIVTPPSITGVIPIDVKDIFALPDVTQGGVHQYVADLAQNEMAILSSLGGIAAPVAGTVDSDHIANFLAPMPITDLGVPLDSLLQSIFSGTPFTFGITEPLNWANLVAESFQNLFNT